MIIENLNTSDVQFNIIKIDMFKVVGYECSTKFNVSNLPDCKAYRAVECTITLDKDKPMYLVYSKLSTKINPFYKQLKHIDNEYIYSEDKWIIYEEDKGRTFKYIGGNKVRILNDNGNDNYYIYLSDNNKVKKIAKMLDKLYRICFSDEADVEKLPIIDLRCYDNNYMQKFIAQYNTNLWNHYIQEQNKSVQYFELHDSIKFRFTAKSTIELPIKSADIGDCITNEKEMKYIEFTDDALRKIDCKDYGIGYIVKSKTEKMSLSKMICVAGSYSESFNVAFLHTLGLNKMVRELDAVSNKYIEDRYVPIVCKLLSIKGLKTSNCAFGFYDFNKLIESKFNDFNLKYRLGFIDATGGNK